MIAYTVERSVRDGSLGGVRHERKGDSLSSVHVSLKKKEDRLYRLGSGLESGWRHKRTLDSVPTNTTYLLEPGWRTQKMG